MKMRREGNTSDLQPPSLLCTMRLTTPPILVIMTNENGAERLLDEIPTFLSPLASTPYHHPTVEIAPC